MFTGTREHFTEMQMSSKLQSFSRRTWPMALSTSASGVTPPYFCSSSRSSEPPLTPMRMGMPSLRQASATARTFSCEPMLPGLMRILSMPCRTHSSASL